MVVNLSFDESSVRAVPKLDTDTPIVWFARSPCSLFQIITQSYSLALFDCHFGKCCIVRWSRG